MKMPPGVHVPERVKALPMDERGYPIPFFAAIIDGKPDLRVSSGKKALRCNDELLCWVCGEKLNNQSCFIGGPKSNASGMYSDGPMHRNCAEFSLQVCPYLALPNAKRREKDLPESAKMADGATLEKPDRFYMVIVKTKDWRFHVTDQVFQIGARRATRVWEGGKEL
jgi:hypothetical protein